MIIDITNETERAILLHAVKSMSTMRLRRGFKVGLTSGCFDLTHYLHLVYLEKCRRLCDFLIVGVDADSMVRSYKSKTPVFPEHNRVAMVNALKCVDAAFIMADLSHFEAAVSDLGVDLIFKNQDALYGEKIVGADQATVVIVPDVQIPDSTTAIFNAIQASAQPKKKR